VRKVFLRAVSGFYSRKAREDGVENGRTGAVNQIQRFGSALNANLHFHALFLDGVYTAPDAFTAPRFHFSRRITDAQVAKLLITIRSRVLRPCLRRGPMDEEDELEARGDDEQGLLPLIQAASIQGRVALGPGAGARVSRLGVPPAGGRARSVVVEELCAELDGFTLHAAVRVKPEESARLEHLCRYVTRPPLSTERLSSDEQGNVVHELRVPYRDGSPSKRPTGAFRSASGGPWLTPRISCSTPWPSDSITDRTAGSSASPAADASADLPRSAGSGSQLAERHRSRASA